MICRHFLRSSVALGFFLATNSTLVAVRAAAAASHRRASSCQVGFSIYNTDKNTKLGFFAIAFGQASATIPAYINATVVAEFCNASTHSVAFSTDGFDGSSVQSVDNSPAPFAINGKLSNGKFKPAPWLQIPNTYIITATPFSGQNGKGSFIALAMQLTLYVASPNQVTSFTLVSANTGRDLSNSLFSYLTIDLANYTSTAGFTIRANTNGTVQSVKMALLGGDYLNKTLVSYTANSAPFVLGGTSPHVKVIPQLRVPGQYLFTATPFVGLRATGRQGLASSLYISVLPAFRIDSFNLVNATSNAVISDFRTIDSILSFPTSSDLTVVANTIGKGGSVEFELIQYRKCSTPCALFFPIFPGDISDPVTLLTTVQNKAPFALGGLTSAGHVKAVPALNKGGIYFVNATTYSGANKQGSVEDNNGVYFVLDAPPTPQPTLVRKPASKPAKKPAA